MGSDPIVTPGRHCRVGDLDMDAVNAAQPLGHSLCEIDGAVLPAGASEGNLEMLASVTPVFLDRLADKGLRRVEKAVYLAGEAGEEIGDWLVPPGATAQGRLPVRIGHRPAVEHKAASVAGPVLRQPALIRERENRDLHFTRAPPFPDFAGTERNAPFIGGFIPAFARCCFCIAANLLVFTSPTMCASLIFPTSEKGTTSA